MTIDIYAKHGLSLSYDRANFDLLLISYGSLSDSSQDVEIRIPVEQIGDFLRDVVGSGTYAMREAALSMAYGECTTCRNVRLVERTTSHGRIERVNCPDCRSGKQPVPFADAPTIGPKVKY